MYHGKTDCNCSQKEQGNGSTKGKQGLSVDLPELYCEDFHQAPKSPPGVPRFGLYRKTRHIDHGSRKVDRSARDQLANNMARRPQSSHSWGSVLFWNSVWRGSTARSTRAATHFRDLHVHCNLHDSPSYHRGLGSRGILLPSRLSTVAAIGVCIRLLVFTYLITQVTCNCADDDSPPLSPIRQCGHSRQNIPKYCPCFQSRPVRPDSCITVPYSLVSHCTQYAKNAPCGVVYRHQGRFIDLKPGMRNCLSSCGRPAACGPNPYYSTRTNAYYWGYDNTTWRRVLEPFWKQCKSPSNQDFIFSPDAVTPPEFYKVGGMKGYLTPFQLYSYPTYSSHTQRWTEPIYPLEDWRTDVSAYHLTMTDAKYPLLVEICKERTATDQVRKCTNAVYATITQKEVQCYKCLDPSQHNIYPFQHDCNTNFTDYYSTPEWINLPSSEVARCSVYTYDSCPSSSSDEPSWFKSFISSIISQAYDSTSQVVKVFARLLLDIFLIIDRQLGIVLLFARITYFTLFTSNYSLSLLIIIGTDYIYPLIVRFTATNDR